MTAVLLGFFFSSLASADGTQIQMLPPIDLKTGQTCIPPTATGPFPFLSYSANAAGGINCNDTLTVSTDGTITIRGAFSTNGDLTTLGTLHGQNIISDGSLLVKGGSITITDGSYGPATLKLGSQTAIASTVQSANELTSVIQTCASHGGGYIAVDGTGNLTCVPSKP
jgi:hypothetical protein